MSVSLSKAKIFLTQAKNAFRTCKDVVRTIGKETSAQSTKIKMQNSLASDTIVLSQEAKTLQDAAKKQYIEKSEYLKKYDEISNSQYYAQLFSDTNILEKIDTSRFIEIEKVCKEIIEKSKTINNGEFLEEHLKMLADLYVQDPKAYRYAIKSEKLLKEFFSIRDYKFQLKYITKNTLQEIEKGSTNPIVRQYVENSDLFCQKPENIETLRKLIANKKISAPITVCRAELHTGIFESIPLKDKLLTAEIKFLNRLLKKHTKEMRFAGFGTNYMSMCFDSKNVYEYIKNKKNLTLADAMLVMQILSKRTQQKVLEMIKGVKLKDNRLLQYPKNLLTNGST